MPTVQGKQYPYTPEGIAAAKTARKAAKGASKPKTAAKPRTKYDMMKGGYNITRNLGY